MAVIYQADGDLTSEDMSQASQYANLLKTIMGIGADNNMIMNGYFHRAKRGYYRFCHADILL